MCQVWRQPLGPGERSFPRGGAKKARRRPRSGGPENALATASAFPSPTTRKTTWLAAESTGSVIVTRSTSSCGTATARRSGSTRTGEFGKSEAVCPSAPSPCSASPSVTPSSTRSYSRPRPRRRARRGCGEPPRVVAGGGRAAFASRAGSWTARRRAARSARRPTTIGRCSRSGSSPAASSYAAPGVSPPESAMCSPARAASTSRSTAALCASRRESKTRRSRLSSRPRPAPASAPWPPGSRSGTPRAHLRAPARGSRESSSRRER